MCKRMNQPLQQSKLHFVHDAINTSYNNVKDIRK